MAGKSEIYTSIALGFLGALLIIVLAALIYNRALEREMRWNQDNQETITWDCTTQFINSCVSR